MAPADVKGHLVPSRPLTVISWVTVTLSVTPCAVTCSAEGERRCRVPGPTWPPRRREASRSRALRELAEQLGLERAHAQRGNLQVLGNFGCCRCWYSVWCSWPRGKTATLSATVSVASLLWELGAVDRRRVLRNGARRRAPMQWASPAPLPRLLLSLALGFLVRVHPAGTSERQNRSLRARAKKRSFARTRTRT